LTAFSLGLLSTAHMEKSKDLLREIGNSESGALGWGKVGGDAQTIFQKEGRGLRGGGEVAL